MTIHYSGTLLVSHRSYGKCNACYPIPRDSSHKNLIPMDKAAVSTLKNDEHSKLVICDFYVIARQTTVIMKGQ